MAYLKLQQIDGYTGGYIGKSVSGGIVEVWNRKDAAEFPDALVADCARNLASRYHETGLRGRILAVTAEYGHGRERDFRIAKPIF